MEFMKEGHVADAVLPFDFLNIYILSHLVSILLIFTFCTFASAEAGSMNAKK